MGKHMIGREAELILLRELVDGLSRGDRRTLLIRGEPGIGKSMLLSTLTGLARDRGLTVLSGRAVAGGGPYRTRPHHAAPPA
jgi:predicted ATPase